MNNLYDVLEICLQELENGTDLEVVLESVHEQYPDLASELRPILKASVMAKAMAVPVPPSDVIRRGRVKLLQRASEMREQKTAPRKRMIPLFQRLAISLSLAAVFLASGTGLVGASSSALPGEHLYPVKRTWEDVRLFFAFNPESHEILEHTFENERLHEVNELFVKGKDETIQFAGVYTEVNGTLYVSGIQVAILSTSILPAQPLLDGMAVMVIGHTNAQGFVDIESIQILPTGSVVPTGEPVENDLEHDDSGSMIATATANSENKVIVTENSKVNDGNADTSDSSDGGDDSGGDN